MATETHIHEQTEGRAHEHHWETSLAPLLAVGGLFLVLPLGFSAFFVYENMMMAAIAAGIGTPLLLWGIALWVREGMTQTPLISGVSLTALPIFIVSECFIFLGLFATYWTMRLSVGAWPPEGTPTIDTTIPLFMTVLLVSSSVTIHIGEEKLENNDLAGFRLWLLLTLLLGFGFLGCTVYEYGHLANLGFIPSTNSFSSAFYGITGFHASHVLVGLGAFIAVLIPLLFGCANKTFVGCASIYWHFVDVVWIFVVSQIYFW